MKPSILWACVLALVLSSGLQAMGQGKGQGGGQEKGNSARAKENASASNPVRQPPETAAPSPGKSDKGKDALQAGKDAKDPAKADVAKGKKVVESAGSAMKGKGREHQQQLQALDEQLRHAQAKQLERQARLARIRELAVQKGDTETVARVDKLIAKQNQVHARKQQHLQTQKRAMEQLQTEGQQAPGMPSGGSPAPVDAPRSTDANSPTN